MTREYIPGTKITTDEGIGATVRIHVPSSGVIGTDHGNLFPSEIASHEMIDDGSDPGNCAVCHFFHNRPQS
jgi:hypothetical protein